MKTFTVQKESYDEGLRDAQRDLDPQRAWDEYYMEGWEDGMYGIEVEHLEDEEIEGSA